MGRGVGLRFANPTYGDWCLSGADTSNTSFPRKRVCQKAPPPARHRPPKSSFPRKRESRWGGAGKRRFPRPVLPGDTDQGPAADPGPVAEADKGSGGRRRVVEPVGRISRRRNPTSGRGVGLRFANPTYGDCCLSGADTSNTSFPRNRLCQNTIRERGKDPRIVIPAKAGIQGWGGALDYAPPIRPTAPPPQSLSTE